MSAIEFHLDAILNSTNVTKIITQGITIPHIQKLDYEYKTMTYLPGIFIEIIRFIITAFKS